jgi:hypothetical protein
MWVYRLRRRLHRSCRSLASLKRVKSGCALAVAEQEQTPRLGRFACRLQHVASAQHPNAEAARAEVKASTGALEQAQAELRSAEVNLEYTTSSPRSTAS